MSEKVYEIALCQYKTYRLDEILIENIIGKDRKEAIGKFIIIYIRSAWIVNFLNDCSNYDEFKEDFDKIEMLQKNIDDTTEDTHVASIVNNFDEIVDLLHKYSLKIDCGILRIQEYQPFIENGKLIKVQLQMFPSE